MGTSYYNLVCGVCGYQEVEDGRNESECDCDSDCECDDIEQKQCSKCECFICSDCEMSQLCNTCSLITIVEEITQIVRNHNKLKKQDIVEKLKSLI